MARIAATTHSAVGMSWMPCPSQSITCGGNSGCNRSTPANIACTTLSPCKCGNWRRRILRLAGAIHISISMLPAGSSGMRTSSTSRVKSWSRPVEIDSWIPTRTIRSVIAQYQFGDGGKLHIRGPFVDLADLGIAVILLDRVVFYKTIATKDLHSVAGNPLRYLGGEILAHACFLKEGQSVVLEPGAVVHHEPSGFNLNG